MKKSIILSFALCISILGCTNKNINSHDKPEYIHDSNPFSFPAPTPNIVYSYENATKFKTLVPISANAIEPVIAANKTGNFVFTYFNSSLGKPVYVTEGPFAGESARDIFEYTYAKTSNNKDLEIKEKYSKPISVAIDSSNNFIVLYTYQLKYFIRKYNIDGVPLSKEVLLNNAFNNYSSYYSNISINSNGEFFVSGLLRKENSNTSDGNTYKPFESSQIFVQKFNSSLEPISDISKLKIDSDSVDMRAEIDKEGNYYISYESEGQIGIVKFDQDGNYLFNKPDLVTGHINYTSHNINFDNNNHLIIIWLKRYELRYLFLRKYSLDLNTFKNEKTEVENFNTNLSRPSLSFDSNNNLTVGWLAEDKSNHILNVFIKKYNSELISLGSPNSINKISSDKNLVYLSNDLNNNLYIFFKSEGSIYLKKYDKNGNLLK